MLFRLIVKRCSAAPDARGGWGTTCSIGSLVDFSAVRGAAFDFPEIVLGTVSATFEPCWKGREGQCRKSC